MNKGFVLSDVLIAIFIVSMTAILTNVVITQLNKTQNLIQIDQESSNSYYDTGLLQIESCEIKCKTAKDISSNN